MVFLIGLRRIVRRLRKKKFQYMAENSKYSQYSVGQYTYGEPVIVSSGEDPARLTIGSFCSIASDVQIMLGGNHRIDWVTTFPFTVLFDEFKNIEGHPATKGDVVIGHDVWIGGDALILSGVTIGDGAVIGAHSVVAKDVAPYSVVVGNPAREVRKRFSEDNIKRLLEMQWWNWDIEKIKSNVPLMLSENIEPFIMNGNPVPDIEGHIEESMQETSLR